MDTMDQIFGAESGSPVGGADDRAAKGAVVNDVQHDDEAGSPAVQTMPMCSFAQFVMTNFRTNADKRKESHVDEKLKYSLDAFCGKYTGEQEAKIQAAGIDPRMYSPVTFAKVRAAKSMLNELVNSADGPLFGLNASPDPEVPEEVTQAAIDGTDAELKSALAQLAAGGMQEIPPDVLEKTRAAVIAAAESKWDIAKARADEWAKSRAKRLLKRVWDVFVQGGWDKALAEYFDDLCVYGTGVIVGPVERVEAVNRMVLDKKTGIRRMVREYDKRLVFERVNPQDVYPAPDAEQVEDGTLCIRVKYTADALWRYAQAADGKGSANGAGWNYHAVNNLLMRHPNGGVSLSEERVDPERRQAEMKGADTWDGCGFEGVRCFASVRGCMLVEMGILKDGNRKDIQRSSYYNVEGIVIDGLVVYCKIYDDRVGRPVSRGKFYEIPGSWWGDSIATKLFMCQYVQNNSVKSMVRNMTVASGPMFWVDDAQRMVDKSPDALQFRPLKVFAFGQSMMGNKGAPMGVLSVPSNAAELLSVFDKFRAQADLDSGIPAFTEGQGQSAGAALRTSSGLAIFTESANRGMKCTMTTTDRLVICPCARRVADWLLINDDDQDIKGDVEIVPTGLVGRIMKAQRDQLRQQFLSIVLNSQYLQQMLGPRAVMVLMRPSVEDIDISADDVVPNEARMKEIEALEAIKQIMQATASQNAAEAAPQGGEGEMAGAPPGVGQPPMPEAPQGGVEERRGVA